MEEHHFHPRSRVWIYTASRILLPEEQERLNNQIVQFCHTWSAHDQKLFAGGSILYNRLLVLYVDESQTGASGCSIDSSVRFIREAGESMNCDFFVRNLVGVFMDGEWEWLDFKSIPAFLESGSVYPDTLVIDTSVSDMEGLKLIEKPLRETWLKRYLKEPAL